MKILRTKFRANWNLVQRNNAPIVFILLFRIKWHPRKLFKLCLMNPSAVFSVKKFVTIAIHTRCSLLMRQIFEWDHHIDGVPWDANIRRHVILRGHLKIRKVLKYLDPTQSEKAQSRAVSAVVKVCLTNLTEIVESKFKRPALLF